MADLAFNHFGQIGAALLPQASQIVRKTAFDVQAGYQQRVAVDTGAEKSAAYVVTNDSSDYSAKTSAAHAANPTGVVLPSVAAPTSATEAIVADAMDYAMYQEFGTVYMPAHPAMIPASEAARPGFEAACKKLFDKA